MMESLKKGEREKRHQANSEVVTRPDGSRVVRVRRRKRRSVQPHKRGARHDRRVGIVMVILGVVVLLALAVGALLLVARFNSRSFREDLSRRAGRATGAEVALEDLSVTPIRARASAARFEWPGNMFLKNLMLSNLMAELRLRSMFGETWSGEELLAQSGTLTLGWPRAESPPAAIEEAFPFIYDRYRCPKFEIRWSDRRDPPVRLYGSEVTLRRPPGAPMQVLLNGGRIAIRGWNEFLLDRGTTLFGSDRVELRSLRLHPARGGGNILVRSNGPVRVGQPAFLWLQADGIPLSSLLGPGLGRLIDAKISSEGGSIECDPGPARSVAVRVDFKGVEGQMEDFLFLSNLQTTLRDSFFSKPTFDTVRGALRVDRSGMRLEDLKFEQRSLLVVRGSIAVSPGEELSGTLEVGVSPNIMIPDTTGKKRWDAFSDPRDGYCWITVELSGRLSDPKDDFSAKLYKAARDAHPDGARNRFEEAFDRLTEP